MLYCGPKIEEFKKQGTSGWVAQYKAEMLYTYMSKEINKYRSKIGKDFGGNFVDHDVEIYGRLLRNKEILFDETNDDKINEMLSEISEHGILWVTLSSPNHKSEKDYIEQIWNKWSHSIFVGKI